MTDDPAQATREKIAEADAALQRAFKEFGIEPGEPVGRPMLEYATRAVVVERVAGPAPSPAMPEVVQAANEFARCGRWIAAGLAVVKLRERFDEFVPTELPPDERTWREFCTKWLAFGADRADQLLGRLIHRGALLKCDGCGAETLGRCACGAHYVPARWPVEAAVSVSSALDRAIAAVRESPDKSNRTLAAEIGASHQTVGRARKFLAGEPPAENPARESSDGPFVDHPTQTPESGA